MIGRTFAFIQLQVQRSISSDFDSCRA